MAGPGVRLYFDFVSPYSWLALTQAEAFGARHRITWDVCPVVYAALLDGTGLIGPAEVEVKRRYTFRDVVRCAARLGLRVSGPPAHPFRSLEALRTVCLFRNDRRALALAVALADAAWRDGRALTDPDVIADVVRATGLPAGDLPGRIGDDAVKGELRRLTAEAQAEGVFGVPSFVYEGELFWGHDRMQHLADRITGKLPAPGAAEAILSRPRGTDRKRSPARGPD